MRKVSFRKALNANIVASLIAWPGGRPMGLPWHDEFLKLSVLRSNVRTLSPLPLHCTEEVTVCVISVRPCSSSVMLGMPLSGMAQATYSLDVILPLTGPSAFTGVTQQSAARAYETIINKTGGIHGMPLHFEFYDDQNDPKIAVQLVNQILTKHPTVILGPSTNAPCAAVAPLLVNGPVEYCFSPASAPPKGGYVFASAATLRDFEFADYEQLHRAGFRRFAVICSTDASGTASLQYAREWNEVLTNKNAQIVDIEAFAPTDLSIAAQVAKVKATNPDIIFLYTIGPAFGTVFTRIAECGIVQCRDYDDADEFKCNPNRCVSCLSPKISSDDGHAVSRKAQQFEYEDGSQRVSGRSARCRRQGRPRTSIHLGSD